MEDYDKGSVIGWGTYGNVYRAVHRPTGKVVALKKVRLQANEGVHMTALREIKLLSELRGTSEHIIEFITAFPHKDKLILVFEYMHTDLDSVLKKGQPLPDAQAREFLRQLLQGLSHIHARSIIHRDIKPDNLLLSPTGTLKIADFGLARLMPPLEEQLQRWQATAPPASPAAFQNMPGMLGGHPPPPPPPPAACGGGGGGGGTQEAAEQAPASTHSADVHGASLVRATQHNHMPVERSRTSPERAGLPAEQDAAVQAVCLDQPLPVTGSGQPASDLTAAHTCSRGTSEPACGALTQPVPVPQPLVLPAHPDTTTATTAITAGVSGTEAPPQGPARPPDGQQAANSARLLQHRQHQHQHRQQLLLQLLPCQPGAPLPPAPSGDLGIPGACIPGLTPVMTAGLPSNSRLFKEEADDLVRAGLLSPGLTYTNQVCARWYRAPELLFGAQHYDGAIDVWAAGCCFAALLLGRVWLSGATDLGQLSSIFRALGSPDPDTWPGVTQLKAYMPFKHQAPPLASLFPTGVSSLALDLLAKLVSLNPAHRPTAQQALQHPFFNQPTQMDLCSPTFSSTQPSHALPVTHTPAPVATMFGMTPGAGDGSAMQGVRRAPGMTSSTHAPPSSSVKLSDGLHMPVSEDKEGRQTLKRTGLTAGFKIMGFTKQVTRRPPDDARDPLQPCPPNQPLLPRRSVYSELGITLAAAANGTMPPTSHPYPLALQSDPRTAGGPHYLKPASVSLAAIRHPATIQEHAGVSNGHPGPLAEGLGSGRVVQHGGAVLAAGQGSEVAVGAGAGGDQSPSWQHAERSGRQQGDGDRPSRNPMLSAFKSGGMLQRLVQQASGLPPWGTATAITTAPAAAAAAAAHQSGDGPGPAATLPTHSVHHMQEADDVGGLQQQHWSHDMLMHAVLPPGMFSLANMPGSCMTARPLGLSFAEEPMSVNTSSCLKRPRRLFESSGMPTPSLATSEVHGLGLAAPLTAMQTSVRGVMLHQRGSTPVPLPQPLDTPLFSRDGTPMATTPAFADSQGAGLALPHVPGPCSGTPVPGTQPPQFAGTRSHVHQQSVSGDQRMRGRWLHWQPQSTARPQLLAKEQLADGDDEVVGSDTDARASGHKRQRIDDSQMLPGACFAEQDDEGSEAAGGRDDMCGLGWRLVAPQMLPTPMGLFNHSPGTEDASGGLSVHAKARLSDAGTLVESDRAGGDQQQQRLMAQAAPSSTVQAAATPPESSTKMSGPADSSMHSPGTAGTASVQDDASAKTPGVDCDSSMNTCEVPQDTPVQPTTTTTTTKSPCGPDGSTTVTPPARTAAAQSTPPTGEVHGSSQGAHGHTFLHAPRPSS